MDLFDWYFLGSLAMIALLILLPWAIVWMGINIPCTCDDDPYYDMQSRCITCRKPVSRSQQESGTLISI